MGTDERTAPPDAGEPAGADVSGRPAMLGKGFRMTLALGMLAGLGLALGGHALLVDSWFEGASGWSWVLAGIGGVAIGGSCALFLYGTATDRHDPHTQVHGRADVTVEGEVQRTLDRRRGRRARGRS